MKATARLAVGLLPAARPHTERLGFGSRDLRPHGSTPRGRRVTPGCRPRGVRRRRGERLGGARALSRGGGRCQHRELHSGGPAVRPREPPAAVQEVLYEERHHRPERPASLLLRPARQRLQQRFAVLHGALRLRDLPDLQLGLRSPRGRLHRRRYLLPRDLRRRDLQTPAGVRSPRGCLHWRRYLLRRRNLQRRDLPTPIGVTAGGGWRRMMLPAVTCVRLRCVRRARRPGRVSPSARRHVRRWRASVAPLSSGRGSEPQSGSPGTTIVVAGL